MKKLIANFTLLFLLAILLFAGCRKRRSLFIGDVYESSDMIMITITLPSELVEINDTLFFVAKNDSMYMCGNKYGNIYARRYKY